MRSGQAVGEPREPFGLGAVVLAGEDRHRAALEGTAGEGTTDGEGDPRGPELAAQQQDVDHLAGRLRGAMTPLERPPEAVEALRPASALALLVEGERARQGAGLAAQQVEVVVEASRDREAAPEALVAGHLGAVVDDGDLPGPDEGAHPQAREADGNRVAVLAEGDEALLVDADLGLLPARKGLGGEGPQERALAGERLAHGLGPPGDPPAEVSLAPAAQAGVELSQRGDLGYGDEPSAAEAAHLRLDAALLVRALESGQGEGRVEAKVRAQGDETVGLRSAAPAQHRLDRRGQVVVADEPGTPPRKQKASAWASRKACCDWWKKA